MRTNVVMALVSALFSGCAQPSRDAAKPSPEPTWAFKQPVERAPAVAAPSPKAAAPAGGEEKITPVARPADARRGQRAPDYRQAMQGPTLPQTKESMNALLMEIDPDGVIFMPGSAIGDGGAVQVQAVWHDLKKSLKMDVLAAISMVWEKRAGGTRLVDLYDPLGTHVAGSTLFRGSFVD